MVSLMKKRLVCAALALLLMLASCAALAESTLAEKLLKMQGGTPAPTEAPAVTVDPFKALRNGSSLAGATEAPANEAPAKTLEDLFHQGTSGGTLPTARPAVEGCPTVVDDAGLLSASDERELADMAQALRDDYGIDAVILTTRSTPVTSSDSRLIDWADRYYEDNGYGLGEDRAGFVYMIDMNNRYAYISTAGVLIDYLDDDRIDSLLDNAQPYLAEGDYAGAAKSVMRDVRKWMDRGIREGNFRYDEVTGERLSGLYNKLTGGEAGLAVLAGAAAALLMLLIVRGSYGLKGSTYRYDLSQNAECRLTRDDERFLRQQVTRVRHDSDSGGSGGHGGSHVHSSSGGMSHGGGGRHF